MKRFGFLLRPAGRRAGASPTSPPSTASAPCSSRTTCSPCRSRAVRRASRRPARSPLDAVVQALEADASRVVCMLGHAGQEGGATTSIRLAAERARAVATALAGRGIGQRPAAAGSTQRAVQPARARRDAALAHRDGGGAAGIRPGAAARDAARAPGHPGTRSQPPRRAGTRAHAQRRPTNQARRPRPRRRPPRRRRPHADAPAATRPNTCTRFYGRPCPGSACGGPAQPPSSPAHRSPRKALHAPAFPGDGRLHRPGPPGGPGPARAPSTPPAPAPQAQPREREATITNQSGQTLRELYAAAPGAADFGPDLLGADTVPDRGTFRARILGAACELEFRAVYQDGTEAGAGRTSARIAACSSATPPFRCAK